LPSTAIGGAASTARENAATATLGKEKNLDAVRNKTGAPLFCELGADRVRIRRGHGPVAILSRERIRFVTQSENARHRRGI
jgi:hypothetical protein